MHLCKVDLVNILLTVQIAHFKYLFQSSTTPPRSPDPCAYKMYICDKSIVVLIWKTIRERENGIPGQPLKHSFKIVSRLFLFFFSPFISLRGGSRICWWCCDSGPALSASRQLPDGGWRFPAPGTLLGRKSGSLLDAGRRGNASQLRCSYSAGSSTCHPLGGGKREDRIILIGQNSCCIMFKIITHKRKYTEFF